MVRHAGVQQDRLGLVAFEQHLELVTPRGDAGEIVLDLGRGHAVLDRLDQPLAVGAVGLRTVLIGRCGQ